MSTTTETKTKERPIIFSAPMIRALLDGRKTQTRQIVKPRHVKHLTTGMMMPRDFATIGSFTPHQRCFEARLEKFNIIVGNAFCPYGVPGDRLWVREKVKYEDANHRPKGLDPHHFIARIEYADGTVAKPVVHMEHWSTSCEHKTDRWRSPIVMPRWASRLTLQIESVRVERVQDIDHPSIAAEGVLDGFDPEYSRNPYQYGRDKLRFELLWDSIHGAGAWDRNDWTWAITFRRV